MAAAAEVLAAHCRASAAAGHRLAEPLAAFGRSEVLERWKLLLSGKAELPPAAGLHRGDNNVFFGGFNSQAGKMRINCYGSNNVVFVGAHARVGGNFGIRGDNNLIYIGAFTQVSGLTVSQRGDGGTFMVGDHGLFSARIFAGNSDDHSIFDLATGKRINLDRDTFIDDRVWVARDVHIAKGTRIGSDTVVGQGSFVSGKLDSNCVYAGVPARKLRQDVCWSRTDHASIAETEASPRHKAFLAQMQDLRARIASFAAPATAPPAPRLAAEEAAV